MMQIQMLRKPHKENSQALYERNYRVLSSLFPEVRQAASNATLVCDVGDVTLAFEILEQTRYTTALNIRFEPKLSAMLGRSTMVVRMYHDARVAEVISFQGHRYIQPHYDFPNDNMYYKDEKRQINRLLTELLAFVQRVESFGVPISLRQTVPN